MIDHVSLPVSDLARAVPFYERVFAPLGLTKLVTRPAMVGFGKTYPEVWINLRPGMSQQPADCGAHICLRARSAAEVDAFPCRGNGRRGHIGKRAVTPAARSRPLLRGVYCRRRRQPDRGSDVSARVSCLNPSRLRQPEVRAAKRRASKDDDVRRRPSRAASGRLRVTAQLIELQVVIFSTAAVRRRGQAAYRLPAPWRRRRAASAGCPRPARP